ncbi:MAG: mercury methylation corrinoid protein HgcA [Candidatus Wallbacteria bacterium]|nr:mercury methylation corrinoid protein HgcA [Candidatus Wallbacteria bacterium]
MSQALWITGDLETSVGRVPQVSTHLTWRDRLGTMMVRSNIQRMSYSVVPGLYAVGNPASDAPVLVSANYKLSFDCLRKELTGIDAWILVLDTKGINVWCAAGKGTFGTEEVIRMIKETNLSAAVSQRTLILPQLGAPGVAAHIVQKHSGFRVIYGPVRACDIPAFLESGLQASREMRKVRFDLSDRLAVVPVELMQWGKYALFMAAILILLAGLHSSGYNSDLALKNGVPAVLLVIIAFFTGGILTPALLPWLPGRAYSVKGAFLGLLLFPFLAFFHFLTPEKSGMPEFISWLLMIPAITSFLSLQFTGATTFTSMSGVKREMRAALPVQAAIAITGLLLWIWARFL